MDTTFSEGERLNLTTSVVSSVLAEKLHSFSFLTRYVMCCCVVRGGVLFKTKLSVPQDDTSHKSTLVCGFECGFESFQLCVKYSACVYRLNYV